MSVLNAKKLPIWCPWSYFGALFGIGWKCESDAPVLVLVQFLEKAFLQVVFRQSDLRHFAEETLYRNCTVAVEGGRVTHGRPTRRR